MARRILFEKMFNEEEYSELIFCGPDTRDGTYAMCMGCPECGEDNQVVLNLEEINELQHALSQAKKTIETAELKKRQGEK